MAASDKTGANNPAVQAAARQVINPPLPPGQLTHVTVGKLESHSGPLPNPEQLQKYSVVVKDGAERIFKMAELEQVHRHTMERRSLFSVFLGQISALLIVLLGVGGGLGLVMMGKPTEGFSSVIGSVALLAGVYVYDRWDRKAKVPPTTPAK